MFGQNETVTPKAFADRAPDELMITSIFYTLQGEGPFSGRSAVFVRLAYCNLRCSFCDTYFDRGERMTFQNIIGAAQGVVQAFKMQHPAPALPKDRHQLMVVTGGEPTMQPNLTGFLRAALRAGFSPQVESNGNFAVELPAMVHLVISPKVNEQTRQFIKLNEGTLRRADSLKFVVSATERGYTDIPAFALDWRAERLGRQIYVSPMNMYRNAPAIAEASADLERRSELERISFWTPDLLDMKANQANHEHAAFLAMKYDARLTIQQHLYAGLP